jgi:hypothetical protein
MAQQQAGAPQGADQPGVSTAQQTQMEASQSRTTRAPAQAAFGSGGGAAIVFRDYASI